MKHLPSLLALFGLFITSFVSANNELKEVEENLKKVNDGAFAQANIEVFSKLDLPGFEGLYIASIGGQALVVDKSGKYAVAGPLVNLDSRMDLSAKYMNQGLSKKAKSELAKLSDDDFVTFAAKGESIGQLYILTDPTCGYCRKLHSEIKELQNAGIDVKYVPYPRAIGPLTNGEPGFEQTKQIMCATDKQDAMNKIKQGRDSGMFEKASYDDACVEHVRKGKALGDSLDIAGTPFLYLSTGDVIKGYQPSNVLIDIFKG